MVYCAQEMSRLPQTLRIMRNGSDLISEVSTRCSSKELPSNIYCREHNRYPPKAFQIIPVTGELILSSLRSLLQSHSVVYKCMGFVTI